MENSDIKVDAGFVVSLRTEDRFVPNNPLRRPKIHYKKPIIALLVYLIEATALGLIPYGKWWICAIVMTAFSIAYFAVIAKRTVIWLVHFYQNKASDETRLKCVFEPSCSEYMILAVNKYGVCKGVRKGVNRLCRCGREHGIDYP